MLISQGLAVRDVGDAVPRMENIVQKSLRRSRRRLFCFDRAQAMYLSRFESCLTIAKASAKTTKTKTTKVVEMDSVSLMAI